MHHPGLIYLLLIDNKKSSFNMYDVKSNMSFRAQTAGIMNQGRDLGTADGSDVGALNLLRTDSLHRNSPVIHLAKMDGSLRNLVWEC
ncbi:hypothetical protein PspCFBP13509_09360 [Pseudomonas sp. CFBP13509]|nr:hypothetical protein PspCFBP13509_09360 [Pseudomonas sp. CFBP13509]